mmetsp:Transcript_39828/g.84916  ORF Transcript_39828/g.84916 Transcript_39828/m.84916 type:complete len:203 (+) Transcript_39828:137-745(+)
MINSQLVTTLAASPRDLTKEAPPYSRRSRDQKIGGSGNSTSSPTRNLRRGLPASRLPSMPRSAIKTIASGTTLPPLPLEMRHSSRARRAQLALDRSCVSTRSRKPVSSCSFPTMRQSRARASESRQCNGSSTGETGEPWRSIASHSRPSRRSSRASSRSMSAWQESGVAQTTKEESSWRRGNADAPDIGNSDPDIGSTHSTT